MSEEENLWIETDCSICGTRYERDSTKNIYTPCPECMRRKKKAEKEKRSSNLRVKRQVRDGIVPEGQRTLIEKTDRGLDPEIVMKREERRLQRAKERDERRRLDSGALPEDQTSLERFGIRSKRRQQ